MHNRGKGNLYEDKTVHTLIEKGFVILDRNYLCKLGEIDIIAKDEAVLVFIEVKYRMNDKYGHPSESINYYKKKHILNTAKWYVKEKRYYDRAIRFDVAIWFEGKLEYYKGAFDYNG
jgi:putative endonuclease